MKWTEEETFKFVELYVERECLWRKSDPSYKDRNKRKAAEQDIIEIMGREGFGLKELKQKIRIIRTTYNQEKLKIKKSRKSGESIRILVKFINDLFTVLLNICFLLNCTIISAFYELSSNICLLNRMAEIREKK